MEENYITTLEPLEGEKVKIIHHWRYGGNITGTLERGGQTYIVIESDSDGIFLFPGADIVIETPSRDLIDLKKFHSENYIKN